MSSCANPCPDLPTVTLEPQVGQLSYTAEGAATLPVTCSAQDSNPPAQVTLKKLGVTASLITEPSSVNPCVMLNSTLKLH